jgi:hypothetical protein
MSRSRSQQRLTDPGSRMREKPSGEATGAFGEVGILAPVYLVRGAMLLFFFLLVASVL